VKDPKRNKSLYILANILSVGFQPILMPILCLVLLYQFNDSVNFLHEKDSILKMYILGITFTIIIPLLVFGFFYWMGWVSDVNLTQRKERVLPFFISILLFSGFYYFAKIDPKINDFILPILFGFIVGTLIANIITSVWKISIHALGISSAWGAVVVSSMAFNDYVPWLLILLGLLAFGVSWSRLWLNRHTLLQLVAGGFLGFFSTFLCAYYKIYI